jgi:Transcriptional repressor TCF25
MSQGKTTKYIVVGSPLSTMCLISSLLLDDVCPSLTRASLAVSRLLLNLDPLRDPMGCLLAIDHFALLENTETNDSWVVEFAESEKVCHECVHCLVGRCDRSAHPGCPFVLSFHPTITRSKYSGRTNPAASNIHAMF